MNYSPWLGYIYKSIVFFYFCSSPPRGQLWAVQWTLRLYECVLALWLFCWSFFSPNPPRYRDWVDIACWRTPQQPLSAISPLCRNMRLISAGFIIKTWRIWEVVESSQLRRVIIVSARSHLGADLVTLLLLQWSLRFPTDSIAKPRPQKSNLNSILLPQLIGQVCSCGTLQHCLSAQLHIVSTEISNNVCWLAACSSGVVSYGCLRVSYTGSLRKFSLIHWLNNSFTFEVSCCCFYLYNMMKCKGNM